MIYRLLAILALVALNRRRRGAVRDRSARVPHRRTVGPRHDPGYAARKARLIQTGPDGQPLYTLDAAQIQQQPDRDTVDLQQVQLGFRDTSGNPWTARADRGQLTQGSGVVQLEGGVRVVGSLPDSGEPAEIYSEAPGVRHPRHRFVTTHDPVTLLMSGRQLHAQGLVASLKERHVQLESAVHGSFQP